ncbi:hypothetical protein LA080_014325 [Diaporthe eres]|nr:hypothetical protein LA080_014325 [Diaporthe eres]
MEKPQAQHSEYSDGTLMSSAPDKTEAAGIVSEVPTESGLRIREDGHIILVPQPTDDEMDPLNWSWSKKHLILLTVAWSAFCADFTSAAGSAPIILQSIEFQKSIPTVNETNSMNVLMMALGGLIWVPMTSIIGRAPTLFWTNLLGFLFSIGTAASPNFRTFYAMRALTGFFITSGQTISIAFIRDIFFFHERARKIGLWALLYIASPFWGPMIGNFVVGGTKSWQNVSG